MPRLAQLNTYYLYYYILRLPLYPMTAFSRFLYGFVYAGRGIADLLLHHRNAKIHLLAAVVAIGSAATFKISRVEWCLVVLCIGVVLAAEAMNTALEYLTDLVSPEYHELARKTKDMAAGAVLLVAFAAAIVGALVFVPKFW